MMDLDPSAITSTVAVLNASMGVEDETQDAISLPMMPMVSPPTAPPAPLVVQFLQYSKFPNSVLEIWLNFSLIGLSRGLKCFQFSLHSAFLIFFLLSVYPTEMLTFLSIFPPLEFQEEEEDEEYFDAPDISTPNEPQSAVIQGELRLPPGEQIPRGLGGPGLSFPRGVR